jgi:hypothetical protein
MDNEFENRGISLARRRGVKAMTRVHVNFNDSHDTPAPEVITALNDLYIISSAGAQLGGYGLDVSDAQRRALARATSEAKTVLDCVKSACETDAVAALRRLVKMCEGIIDLYSTCQACPSAVWREVGRLGREAYEYIDQARIVQRRTINTRLQSHICEG